jgi:hypothetical protein
MIGKGAFFSINTYFSPCLRTLQNFLDFKMRRFDLTRDNTNQNSSGRGLPSKKDLNSTSDLSGCENGTSCDAPLTVANDSMLP